MVVKSFNIEEHVYKKFSDFCKGQGLSMSKQVEFFMRSFIESDEKVRENYLQKLEKIRGGKFVRVKSLDDLL